jgi:DNA-binding IclR family transcriptional regulator
MLQIITARWVSSATSVAAKLGIADELAGGPKPVEDLARAVKAHADSVRRLLRALASVGIFTQDEQDRFANTPLSETLRSGPGSLRAMARA